MSSEFQNILLSSKEGEDGNSTGNGDIVTDERVFELNYIPDKLRYRQEELKELAEHLKPLIKKKVPQDLSIYGKTGTGKTAAVKYAKKQIEETIRSEESNVTFEDVKISYVNCKDKGTQTQVYSQIARSISDEDIAKEGHSSSYYLEEIMSTLNDNNAVLLVILDEIDLLMEKEDLDSTLYSIIDKTGITTIMVSNDLRWKNKIEDRRVKSRMGITTTTFTAYNEEQLTDIIRDRAEQGLRKNAWDEEIIGYIAGTASREYGDARTGIKLLGESAILAQKELKSEKIQKTYVDNALEVLDDVKALDFISTLSSREKILTYAIADLKNKGKKTKTSAILNKYNKLIKDSDKFRQLKKTTLYDYINELNTYGIIEKEKRGRGYGKGIEMETIPNFDVKRFLERCKNNNI